MYKVNRFDSKGKEYLRLLDKYYPALAELLRLYKKGYKKPFPESGERGTPMKDSLREYLSYGGFILPLLKVKKTIRPQKVQWGNRAQYFLHYSAPSPKGRTLVIYIHGGGWNSGSPSDFHFIGQRFALEGYDCILPGYRKAPKYHYDGIADDIFRGYREIQAYLRGKNAAYTNITVVGSSAGAHLGALLCFDSERREKYAISPGQPDGFVSLAGPLCFDFPQTWAQNKLMRGLFSSSSMSVWKTGEPLSKLRSGQGVRTLVVQSRHDGVIGFEQAEAFCRRALELGIDAELFEVPEARNTHSAYSAGIFLRTCQESATLRRVFDWIS